MPLLYEFFSFNNIEFFPSFLIWYRAGLSEKEMDSIQINYPDVHSLILLANEIIKKEGDNEKLLNALKRYSTSLPDYIDSFNYVSQTIVQAFPDEGHVINNTMKNFSKSVGEINHFDEKAKVVNKIINPINAFHDCQLEVRDHLYELYRLYKDMGHYEEKVTGLRIAFTGSKKEKEKKERNDEKLAKAQKDFKEETAVLKQKVGQGSNYLSILNEPITTFLQTQHDWMVIYIFYL